MSRLQILGLCLAFVLFAGSTVVLRRALEPEASHVAAIRDPAWLPDGRVLRVAAMGQRLVVSDLFWLRLVQYVGETVMSSVQRWDALHPLADLVTDLDPRHGYAYQVAGSNLGGLAGRHAEAERILQKGMRNLPDRWSLPFVHATNKFLFEQDYAEAAEYTRRAAEIGKKPHLALLAANLAALADTDGEYAAAISFLEQSAEQADTLELREELRAREIKIRTYQVLSEVEKAIRSFEQMRGRLPFGLHELIGNGLATLPRDPSGGTLVYDPLTGEVLSTVIGPRAPLRITR